MKVVILAGGRGTRLSEHTDIMPKPMVEIGSKPILWHIMKMYSSWGFSDFIICLGYRGYVIKEYFYHYFLHMSDVTVDLKNNDIKIHNSNSEPWKVTMVDTGFETLTGTRLKKIERFVRNEPFMMTYGDGLGDIDIKSLVKFHKKHAKLATVTAVRPLGRFGALDLGTDGRVKSFLEKPAGDNNWINAGFFVLEPGIFKYIKGDNASWEKEPLEGLSRDGELAAYRHSGFWMPMDTLRDKQELERLWINAQAPWKAWK